MEALVESAAPAFAPPANVVTRSRSATPIVVVVILLFGCSGGLLWYLGYNYNGLSGNPFSKIHPATYLILAIFLWNAVASGNPARYAAEAAWKRPASFFLLMAMAALFAQTVSRATPGMAGSLDTFLGPPLLVVLMSEIDERGMRRIETALHTLMTLNALIALAEFVTNRRFFPFRYDGLVDLYDMRSNALQGHPLENAAITAFYILALLSSNTSLPKSYKVMLISLQLSALVTFGGRTATVVALLLASIYFIVMAHRTLRAGRISILGVAATLILTVLAPIVVVTLASGGFFDTLMTRFFVSDSGSANSRLEMFKIFESVPLRDLLVGPDLNLIASERWLHGLEQGIENPIITMLLYQGLMMAVLMTTAIAAFLYEVAGRCVRGVWLPMLAFVILTNSSESIASKTDMVTKFVAVLLCLYRPRPRLFRLRLSPGPRAGATIAGRPIQVRVR